MQAAIGSQRSHLYDSAIGAVPDHRPAEAASVRPSRAVPVSTGAVVLTGGA